MKQNRRGFLKLLSASALATVVIAKSKAVVLSVKSKIPFIKLSKNDLAWIAEHDRLKKDPLAVPGIHTDKKGNTWYV